MLNRTGDGLLIFETFVKDGNLPKYRKKKKSTSTSLVINSGETEMTEMEFVVSGGNVSARRKRKGLWSRFWGWFWGWITADDELVRVLRFFKQIKESSQDIKLLEARARGYEEAIARANRAGQIALQEKLQDGLGAYIAETHMLSIGITQFVSEESVVRFYKECKKGVRLDWLKNFTRAVPPELVELKVAADELEIFDNYAVMHYDPNKKSWAETKQEIAAKRDPILFGLLKGRSDLYILGDWTDEFCDLTLDGMAEVLGENPRHFIDKEWVEHEADPDQEENPDMAKGDMA